MTKKYYLDSDFSLKRCNRKMFPGTFNSDGFKDGILTCSCKEMVCIISLLADYEFASEKSGSSEVLRTGWQ